MTRLTWRILKRVAISSAGNGLFSRSLLSLIVLQLLVSCGTQGPEEKSMEVHFREIGVEPRAVSKILPLVAACPQPDEADLSLAHQSLFTHLAQTDPVDLVTTKPHSQGKWRIERVFLLDDCVAVEMSEGHYMETLFFVQYRNGWRLKSRIIPKDHEYEGKG